MKIAGKLLVAGLAAMLIVPSVTFAADTSVKSADTTTVQNGSARTAEQVLAEREAKKKAEDSKQPKPRYVQILNDDGFNYSLDTKNARWIQMPHSGNEYIADVWIRLDSDGTHKDEDKDGNYKVPQTYYLEHYYIRPQTQQIQFLCELEVTGRPDNAIHERAYSMANWENLVPGSIEDDIYHSVIQNMQKNKLTGKSSNGMSVRDKIEEYLRISL